MSTTSTRKSTTKGNEKINDKGNETINETISDNVSHWTTNNSRRRMNNADPPTHVDKGVSLFNR